MRLTAADASFLYTESASGPTHISSIVTLEGELGFEQIFHHFETRIHLVPSYRRKLAQVPLNIAHPEWIDDAEFDLRNHIHHTQLPPTATEQDAIDAAITLNERLLDRSLPLWQLHVIQGVPGKTYLLQETHHAMIDGASGVDLMTIIFDYGPEGREIEPPKEHWAPQAAPDAMTLVGNAMRDNMSELQGTDWRGMFDSASNQRLLQRTGRMFAEFVSRPVITAPFNAGLVTARRRFRVAKISYDKMREVRQSLGGTINDVVLSVVSEAVARYLEAAGEPTNDQHMRIMCPVNVRTESEKGALGNKVSGVFPVLPAWPMPMAKRLTVVREVMDEIKENQNAQLLASLQDNAPPVWPLAMAPTQLVGTPFDPTAFAAGVSLPSMPSMPAGLPRPPNPGINFVCTNVPGVQVQQYLCGHAVTEQVGVLCLLGNSGLGVTILSYNKNFYFGFISEPKLLPDVERIAEAAISAFADLLEAAGAASKPKAKPQPKAKKRANSRKRSE